MKKYASAEIWRRADASDLDQIGKLAGRKMASAGLHSAPRMRILGGAADAQLQTLGERAYNAYCAAVKQKPKWQDQRDSLKAAWHAAANVVAEVFE